MRQHPIPQNILDVEFKLFTKFTLKEFAYLALGIGFGGLVLYLTVSHVVPGVLGVPVFIASSAAGIFLGLVPINDQDADVFIKNYVAAIGAPTQRVWLNKELRDERSKPELKPNEQGQLIHKDAIEKKTEIIGGNLLEAAPVVQEETAIPETAVQEEIPTPEVKPIDPNLLVITDENISNYQFNIKSLDQLPGNINVWLCTKNMQPIPNVITYLKSKDGKILYANKTGVNGYFLTNKIWEPEVYEVEFQHPQYTFPKLQIVLTRKENKLPIKISAI